MLKTCENKHFLPAQPKRMLQRTDEMTITSFQSDKQLGAGAEGACFRVRINEDSDVAMKVYNQERRPRSDSVAAKEYKLLKELESETNIVKPIYLFEKGEMSFKHPRTGVVKTFQNREMVMMELCA